MTESVAAVVLNPKESALITFQGGAYPVGGGVIGIDGLRTVVGFIWAQERLKAVRYLRDVYGFDLRSAISVTDLILVALEDKVKEPNNG